MRLVFYLVLSNEYNNNNMQTKDEKIWQNTDSKTTNL